MRRFPAYACRDWHIEPAAVRDHRLCAMRTPGHRFLRGQSLVPAVRSWARPPANPVLRLLLMRFHSREKIERLFDALAQFFPLFLIFGQIVLNCGLVVPQRSELFFQLRILSAKSFIIFADYLEFFHHAEEFVFKLTKA